MGYVILKLERPDDDHICDFCSSPGVYASHAAHDFVDPATKGTSFVSESKGAWAACKACDELIRAENWDGLAQRSAEKFFEKYAGMIDPRLTFAKFKQEMYALHEEFRKHRIKAA